jgi:hypothetical protein
MKPLRLRWLAFTWKNFVGTSLSLSQPREPGFLSGDSPLQGRQGKGFEL